MVRQKIKILSEYESLVKALELVCKTLGWKVKFKQEDERLLQVELDGCAYNVAPQANDSPESPVYYLSVMVQYPGNRDEPPSEDEKTIAESFRDPRKIITTLIDAHWSEKRHWALEQDYLPQDEEPQY